MQISILGCGWLGFPLAQELLESGYNVKGSTRSDEKFRLLEENGVEAHRLTLPEDLSDCGSSSSSFWKSNTLFLNIPPGRGTENVVQSYTEKIESVRSVLESKNSDIQQVIFASSTSVYPMEEGSFTEEMTDINNTSRPSGKAVLRAEEIICSSDQFETIVLRFGGLYGYSRHPVKQLSGRTGIKSPYKPVNLIHQRDCIRIVQTLLKSEISSGIYNAVSDGHPPRKTLYQSAARHYDVPEPQFDEESDSINRIILNEKLKEEFDFSFNYPNPMDHTA
ncbi:SDR family oxidoreductase [Rhodohalobacter sp. SW132]|uniref:SDR family oxidoreductase n=1 Tax=Rhodohalobacter sp. SW132 TaxID=2293433 RepID=UPI000E22A250|nr:SDR family oxidoreductase [Rhodohalobacter sp. SW132]REL37611.1 SDR family oxidoreductase [Rhodohalobacter sp. SW132]